MLRFILLSTSWSTLLFFVIHTSVIISITANQEITSEQITYLKYYGYLEDQQRDSGALQTQESLQNSIKKFQRFARISVTGKIDHETIQRFQQPRCGIRDGNIGMNRRNKRYVLQGSKWDKKDLTYQIENWTEDISADDVRKTIRNTLSRWQKASQIRFFHKPTGYADIMIRFTRKKHNDQYTFDGPGGTLAHAFYPGNHPLSGDTHFDDDETFSVRSKKGKNFYWVALHEFGHALGLEHSNADGAVMFPWYEGYKGYDVDLSDDDKRGIQALYGTPNNNPAYEKTVPDKNNKECLDRVKSIFVNRFGETVVINLDKLYIYDRNLNKKKGPIVLENYYSQLSSTDGVYTLPNRRVIFFHEDGYSEYMGQRRRFRRPSTKNVFGDGIFNIDGAFYWSQPKKVYIFKGHVYWRYDPTKRRMDSGYPKLIRKNWKGVPDDIDAVFEWSGTVFFFKDDQYFRYDENRYEVTKLYPRPITSFLLCNKNSPRSEKFISSQQKDSNSSSNKIGPRILWYLASVSNILVFSYLSL